METPRIDTHHHLYPPRFLAEQAERILGVSAGFPSSIVLEWTPQRSLDVLDEAGVSAAILSISAPGIWFGDNAAASGLARDCNEYGARLVADHGRRFGMFAALPLPDVAASLAEIAYAFDVLKLDGIGLMTSYGLRSAQLNIIEIRRQLRAPALDLGPRPWHEAAAHAWSRPAHVPDEMLQVRDGMRCGGNDRGPRRIGRSGRRRRGAARRLERAWAAHRHRAERSRHAFALSG